jgi:hypothetical protein
MAHIYNYAVLMAIPDPGRGERVNVGVVVFLDNRIDVRFAELSKVRAITGQRWEEYVKGVERRLIDRFSSGLEAQEEIARAPQFDKVFHASDVAQFSIYSESDYEARVREILDTLVTRPKLAEIKFRTTRINTEIAKQLRKVKVLAAKDEPLHTHKVVRNYLVEDELHADFAQMNGVLRCAATLDLRRPHADIKETTLKAITLDRARATRSEPVERIGVYATATPDSKEHRYHIELLGDYSERTFNWEDPDGRRAFMNFVYSGLGAKGSLT